MEFRKAQLLARQNLTLAQRREREILLQSYSQPVSEATSPTTGPPADEAVPESAAQKPPPPSRQYQIQRQQQQQSSLSEDDQQQVGASSNVTLALRRTHELIAAELAKSDFAHQTLTESTAALAQLDESYGSLDSMLASSRDLLGTLLRSQKSDTWYLQTALYMLMATGAWLLYRRIFYHLVWLAVLLPLRMALAGTMSVGRAVGVFGPRQTTGIVTGGVETASGKVVMENGDAPTVKVGQQAQPSAAVGDPDSMVEKVGKIVEDQLETGDAKPGGDDAADGEEVQPNPMKRMWEEPVGEAAEDTRQRDEL